MDSSYYGDTKFQTEMSSSSDNQTDSKLPTSDFSRLLHRLLLSATDITLRENFRKPETLLSLFTITSILISLLSQRELYLAWKNHIGELNNFKDPRSKGFEKGIFILFMLLIYI
jgi:hypothetical protein